VAEPGAPARPGKKGISRFVSVTAAPAPPPIVPPRPQGSLTRASIEEIAQAVRTTWPTKSADNRWNRSRGARDLLHHLSDYPGETWQDRWEASGFNELGRPVSVLRSAPRDRSQIGTGAACLFCLRIIQPSLAAFRSNIFLYYGKRFLAAQNDQLLEKFWAEVQDTPVNPIHHGTALFDVTVALTTQGIALADLTPAAFLHYAWECRRQGLVLGARGAGSRFPGHLAWQVLHRMDHFPSHGPATLKAALLNGRLTVEELVDRYKICHAGVRHLLIAYLERRKPELDYSTLDNLSRHLASNFWATIERLAPSQPDLRIDAGLYQQWRDQVAVRADGKGRRDFDPILRAVRAFYADLQAWAAAEPEQWAIWVAPCPVTDADARGYGIRKRRVKERMDDRTRQRQPLLSTLVEHMGNRYDRLRELLALAVTAADRQTITVGGRVYRRLWSRVDERRVRLGGPASVRVLDLESGKYLNLTHAEDVNSPISASGSTSGPTARSSPCLWSPRPRATGNASSPCPPSCSPSSQPSSAVTPPAARPSRSCRATTRKSGWAAPRCRSCSSARSAPSTRSSLTRPS